MNLSAKSTIWTWIGSAFLVFSALSLSGHADTAFSLATTLQRLGQSKSGQALIHKAMAVWNLKSPNDLLEKLRWSNSSRTDAVLIRRYDVETGKETRERKVTVYLREHQSINNTVLDLAHELVHATSRPDWDPYDSSLTAARYIKTSIEGTGGEVEAVLLECRVGSELGISDMTNRCQKYLGSNFSRVNELIRQDFYRVGKWFPQIKSTLGPEFSLIPLLSPDTPALYSSTGGAPYPISLMEEYKQMTQVACENTKRRVESQGPQDRAPASTASLQEDSAGQFLTRRCGTQLATQ